jgi:hypothetical protein
VTPSTANAELGRNAGPHAEAWVPRAPRHHPPRALASQCERCDRTRGRLPEQSRCRGVSDLRRAPRHRPIKPTPTKDRDSLPTVPGHRQSRPLRTDALGIAPRRQQERRDVATPAGTSRPAAIRPRPNDARESQAMSRKQRATSPLDNGDDDLINNTQPRPCSARRNGRTVPEHRRSKRREPGSVNQTQMKGSVNK